MLENEITTMENATEGKAEELFQMELKAVLGNIFNGATDEGKSREITLKFKVYPIIDNTAELRKDRIRGVSIKVESSSSLDKLKTRDFPSFIGFDQEGMPIALKNDPYQLSIFNQMKQKKEEAKNGSN